MNDWNIQSRAHACQSCEQRFSDKQPYFTLLFDGKELTRLDVCEPCWKEKFSGKEVDPDKKPISRWRGVYEAPPAAPPEAIQKDTAETLLRKLMELNDPKHGGACFILAVMLERKRLLKEKEQIKRDGQRTIVYEHPKSGDLFTITDPNLQLDQLEEVQRDVANLLENGLPMPEGSQSLNPAPVPESAPADAPTKNAPSEDPSNTATPTEENPSDDASGNDEPEAPATEAEPEPAKN